MEIKKKTDTVVAWYDLLISQPELDVIHEVLCDCVYASEADEDKRKRKVYKHCHELIADIERFVINKQGVYDES